MWKKPYYPKQGSRGSHGFKAYGGSKGFPKKTFGGYGKTYPKKNNSRPHQQQNSSKAKGTFTQTTVVLKVDARYLTKAWCMLPLHAPGIFMPNSTGDHSQYVDLKNVVMANALF